MINAAHAAVRVHPVLRRDVTSIHSLQGGQHGSLTLPGHYALPVAASATREPGRAVQAYEPIDVLDSIGNS
jgi:hypothetical protein